MDRGIYNATAAGLIADRTMQIVSNNIANANTTGFKGQRLSTRQQEFTDTLANLDSAEVSTHLREEFFRRDTHRRQEFLLLLELFDAVIRHSEPGAEPIKLFF